MKNVIKSEFALMIMMRVKSMLIINVNVNIFESHVFLFLLLGCEIILKVNADYWWIAVKLAKTFDSRK